MTPTAVTLRGITATYTDQEREIMRGLVRAGASASEVLFIHDAKAMFGGTLGEEAVTTDGAAPSPNVPTGHGRFEIPEQAQAQIRNLPVTDG